MSRTAAPIVSNTARSVGLRPTIEFITRCWRTVKLYALKWIHPAQASLADGGKASSPSLAPATPPAIRQSSGPNTAIRFTSNLKALIQELMSISSIKNHLATFITGATLGVAITLCIGATARNSGNTAWEYKVVSGEVVGSAGSSSLERSLNATAADGWDFVSSSYAADHWAFAVLKRERR